jgi:hypothetical protein
MSRSLPSQADKDLLAELAGQGLTVSARKLEMWRAHGLLPRPVVERVKGGGSRVVPHGEMVLQLAACLASAPQLLGNEHRIGAWQEGAFVVFEDGLPLSEAVMRECLVWLLDRVYGAATRLWAEAVEMEGFGPGHLSEDELAQVGEVVARLCRRNKQLRSMRAGVLDEFRSLGYLDASREEIAGAAYEALGLRLAAMAGASLTPDLEAVARFGRGGTPPAGLTPVLPHEVLACARSLTLREAQALGRVFRARCYLSLERKTITGVWSLPMANLMTASHRLNEPPYKIDVPLDETSVRLVERNASDLEDEIGRRAAQD